MSKRKFTWFAWDFDLDGDAYIIAMDECPNREDVPEWIVKTDCLDPHCLDPGHGECLSVDDVEAGWCKFQVRSDWYDGEGKPGGWYVVKRRAHSSIPVYLDNFNGRHGKRKPGWFPVWIVRKGEWY